MNSGDPDQGPRLLDRAARHHDRTPAAAARTWLASLRAVAFAAVADRPSTVDALRQARRLADREPSAPQWPWVFAFTSHKVARYESDALAGLDDLTGARTAHATATEAITAPKPLALAKIQHANLLAAHQHVDEACELAKDALRTGQAYGSERIISECRRLRSVLPAGRQVSELDDLFVAIYEGESP